MEKTKDRFYVTIVLDRYTIVMIEENSTDVQRNIVFSLDGRKLGQLSFFSCYMPCYAFDEKGVIRIWAGTRLYSIELAAGRISCFDEEEEICAVYLIDKQLLIVREISVILRERSNHELLATYDHNDVITENYLENDHLIITDFNNKSFLVEFNSNNITARHIKGK